MSEPREKPVKVVQAVDEEVVPVEIIAQSIVRLDDGVKRMTLSGLRENAIVVLLHDYCGVGKPAIRDVLKGLRQLRSHYTTK